MMPRGTYKKLTDPHFVVGLMSGTSGDGVDAALVHIQLAGADRMRPHVTPLAHITIAYDAELKQRLFPLFDVATARLDHLCDMNVRLAEQFVIAAKAVVAEARIDMSDVDVIGSHGQTVHHLPPRQAGITGSTLQIGEPSVIAELTGVPVVSNFRARDMAAGGQGAPLVPYVDWLLLGEMGTRQAIQNIGGIGNVTVLPACDGLDRVIAFDTGPGNMVIDAFVRHMTNGQYDIDWDGRIAGRGHVIEPWLNELLQHDYFSMVPPKTTGREEFGADYARGLWSEGNQRGYAGDDMVATATALTTASIADQYRRFVLSQGTLSRVVLGGGGAKNRTLVQWLQKALHPIPVMDHENIGWPSDAKEAIAFALLAWSTWIGRSGNVPSVTGALGPRQLGTITYA